VRSFLILFLLAGCGSSNNGPVTSPGIAVGADGKAPEILTAHNEARKRSGAGLKDLVWSADIAKSAQAWADTLAGRGCNLEHSGQSKYGENLYSSSGASSGRRVVDAWESEAACYKYSKFPDTCTTSASCSSCGHYTQLVWRNTVNLGCGLAKCGDAEVWVCQYDPPGNFVGQFPY